MSLRASLVLAAAVAGWSCGDDEPPPRQAVSWLGLSSGQGATCSSANSFQIPSAIAQGIVTGSTGKGPEGSEDRVKDTGADRVDCSLSSGGADGAYSVTMAYSNPANGVGALEMSGTLIEGQTVAFQLNFQSNAVSLSTNAPAQPCMAHVKRLNPAGAIWIDNLSCPDLRDYSSPAIRCVGSGGLIFENCN
jgi:hypothetical protein